jgi:SNF2 family DNA or RNA helicase
MEIIQQAALKIGLPPALSSQVCQSIGRSERLADGNLLVCWDHDEAEILAQILDSARPARNLPEVPSPMLRDYNWPGIFTPFEHQKTTASFLSIRRRAFCFSEMGVGKTSSAIWAADYLMGIGAVKRVLIICPLSIMYSAWQADIFKTAMHRTAVVAYGDKNKRDKAINGSYDFVIINYDGVSISYDAILKNNFDLIIVDEANSYKNASTKRWKVLAKLLTPNTRLWMMTGTPAAQSPLDAFGLAKMVSPSRIPKFATVWRDRVMAQISRFRWVPKKTARADVHYVLQPAIRFTKKECLDIPDVTYVTREVPMTAQVSKFYRLLKTQMMIEAANTRISAVNAAASLSKLLQISGGAVYTDHHQVVEFDVSPRLQVLGEVLDETINKVVVFVPFLHTIEIVAKFLGAHGITTEIIQGSVSPRERSEIINRFQTQANPRALVIQPQAASHGVTLTAADTMVFWSPVMSVETYTQCVGRIDRYGQKNPMTVVHLQSSEAERKVYTMLQGKIDSHMELVELYKQLVLEDK